MAVILKPLNDKAGHSQKPAYTFGVYLTEVFLPLCRRKWKESTRMTTESRMVHHLTPTFGPELLHRITRDHMQLFLDRKARCLSHSIVDHLRWDLNAIFKTALSDGLVQTNVAAALFTPPCKPDADKKVMTPEQIRQALRVLAARERLIFRMAVFDGMRPGEILAIRLGKISEDSILADQRVYKGNIDTPKDRKGKRTSRVVGLSPGDVDGTRTVASNSNRWTANVFVSDGAGYSVKAGQYLEPGDTAQVEDGWAGMGHVPGASSNQRQPVAKGADRR